jgi:hypothetical protein
VEFKPGVRLLGIRPELLVGLLLALLLLPAAAHAQQWGKTCDDDPAIIVPIIGGGSNVSFDCYNFETEGATNSNTIRVGSFSAIFCLDPAIDTDGATFTVCLDPRAW